MSNKRWSKDQLKLAFNLYCQLPFGKMHRGNSEVIELANNIGRTPSAVAMKLVNFASLDPAITNSGRNGLGNASALDREVWDEFHADWEHLAMECASVNEQIKDRPLDDQTTEEALDLNNFVGVTRLKLTELRIKQSFFRRAVLASYRGRCCISGLSEPRLLIASHIIPWSKDKANRLNPSNGLCLSALHDKAFDCGLITLDTNLRVVVSKELKQQNDAFAHATLQRIAGKSIELPERFHPSPEFLEWHRSEIFVDAKRP